MTRHTIGLLALLAVGCTASVTGPTVDLDAERRALMEADAAWFASHEDIDEFMTFLTDDAIFMPADAPLARGEGIRAVWEHLLALPGFELEWSASSASVAGSGDLGYTTGAYRLTAEQDGTPMVTVGKYVTVWEKQADGRWKVAVDCFNADGPAVEAS